MSSRRNHDRNDRKVKRSKMIIIPVDNNGTIMLPTHSDLKQLQRMTNSSIQVVDGGSAVRVTVNAPEDTASERLVDAVKEINKFLDSCNTGETEEYHSPFTYHPRTKVPWSKYRGQQGTSTHVNKKSYSPSTASSGNQARNVYGTSTKDRGRNLNGVMITLTETIVIPSDKYPDYNFIAKIIGPKRKTLKQLQKKTNSNIIVVENRTSVRVSIHAPEGVAAERLAAAVKEVNKYMDPHNAEVKEESMRELAELDVHLQTMHTKRLADEAKFDTRILEEDGMLKLSEKIVIPPECYSGCYNVIARIMGRKGSNIKHIREKTQSNIQVYGKGSLYDREFETILRDSGDPIYAHFHEPLNIVVSVCALKEVAKDRLATAVEEVKKYMVPKKEEEETKEESLTVPKKEDHEEKPLCGDDQHIADDQKGSEVNNETSMKRPVASQPKDTPPPLAKKVKVKDPEKPGRSTAVINQGWFAF